MVNQAAVEKQFHQKLLDVSDLLASLDITVGFLVSVGGDPNGSLVQFMVETLKMKIRRHLLTDAVSICRCLLSTVCVLCLTTLCSVKEEPLIFDYNSRISWSMFVVLAPMETNEHSTISFNLLT